MELTRFLFQLQRPLANILDRHTRNNDRDNLKAPFSMGGDQHTGQARVQWDPRQRLTDRRENRIGGVGTIFQRAELMQYKQAITDATRIWRVNEREVVNIA